MIVTYRVEQENGPWLWVKAEGRGLSGWALADQVVPVDDAIAFFTDYIRANPGDSHGYQMRAIIWFREKKEIDIALADLNEALRLLPTDAALWTTRGNAWFNKKEYDKAIADDSEAIRLDPKLALAYNNRGNAWGDKKEYDKAIADYSEAIRLDPKFAWPYFGRALTLLLARREGAPESAPAGLEASGWQGEQPIYMSILGHLAAGQAGQGDRAKAFLDDAAAHGEKNLWPYPIVRYLSGELDEAALLSAATDDDKRTEVHGYVGFASLLKGRKDEARTHFQWVKDHGNPAYIEYTLALAELERMGPSPVAASGP